MIIIRPVKPTDINQLMKLAKKVAPGITTFPPNVDVLSRKIESSMAAFTKSSSEEMFNSYLMVMENTEINRIMGTCAIYTNIGKEVPFYNFDLVTKTKHCNQLQLDVASKTLYLVNEYNGDTEIGTLVLDPDFRGGGYGKLLAKSRYLLIAQFQKRFGNRVFAELRGWSDNNFQSPFWQAVGKHFFGGMSYERADYLSATTNNQFIADLMPDYPLYLDLLPESAQSVVGKAHPTGEAALKMLFSEGFRYENFVDIFDAGPTVHVHKNEIVTVKNSRLYKAGNITENIRQTTESLICNTFIENFRVCQSYVDFSDDNGVSISKSAANSLSCELGDQLRILDLSSS